MPLNIITACLEFVMYKLSGWCWVTVCTIVFRVCYFLKNALLSQYALLPTKRNNCVGLGTITDALNSTRSRLS